MAYTALSELTASMGSAYELVIKPSYELDIDNNRVKMQVSYGVRKIGANSSTYNIDASRMWATFGTIALLGVNGTHISWDQRKDAVGTYHEYAATTGWVPCNNDGTSSVYLYAKFDVGNVSMAKTAEISRTITLPRVPRPSTISATPTFIGQATMITIQRASSNFRHTVQYRYSVFGDTIGNEKRADTSFSWVVPTDFYMRLFGKSITIQLLCDTYDGDTLIGQTSCEFTATVPDAPNKPTIDSHAVFDNNFTCQSLAGENLVRYKSVVQCSATATAKNYANIQSITVNGQEMYLEETGTTASGTALISNVDTGTFVFVATDTRGFTTTVTQELTLIPYEVVTLAYTWARPSSTGSTVNLTLNGRWFNGSFGLKTNTLTVEVKVKRSDSSTWGTTTAVNTTKSGNTWKATLTLSGLSYDYSYDVSIRAYDAFGTESTSMAEAVFTIPPGTPVFDWGKSDLTVNKRLFCNGSIRIKPGTTTGQMGLFAAESATASSTFRLVSTSKSSSEEDRVFFGSNTIPSYYYGGPTFLYFKNNAGGIYCEDSNGDYVRCGYVNGTKILVGTTPMNIAIQGNRVELGTTASPTYLWGSQVVVGGGSYPTYIYGSYLSMYLPNNKGGIYVKTSGNSSYNAMSINTSDEVLFGVSSLVTRLSGRTIYSSTNITVSSDRGNKKAIEPVPDAYEVLLDKLEPQRFRYKDEADDAPYHVGYIAQDVLDALEDAGLHRTDLAAIAGEEGGLGIAYAELVPLLHKKVKTLEARVAQLERLVEKLLNAQGLTDKA